MWERWSDQTFQQALDDLLARRAAAMEVFQEIARTRQCRRCKSEDCAMKRYSSCERKARLKRLNFHCPLNKF